MFTGINHIVIFSSNTEVSKDWYKKVGFTYVEGYEGMHWFEVNGIKIMLHPSESINPGLTAIHINVENIYQLFDHVVSNGLEPFDHSQPGVKINAPVIQPWGDVDFQLSDPDGHQWAFVQVK